MMSWADRPLLLRDRSGRPLHGVSAPVSGPRWGLLTRTVSQSESELCLDRLCKTIWHKTVFSARNFVPITHCDHRPAFNKNRHGAQRADGLGQLLHFSRLRQVGAHHIMLTMDPTWTTRRGSGTLFDALTCGARQATEGGSGGGGCSSSAAQPLACHGRSRSAASAAAKPPRSASTNAVGNGATSPR